MEVCKLTCGITNVVVVGRSVVVVTGTVVDVVVLCTTPIVEV